MFALIRRMGMTSSAATAYGRERVELEAKVQTELMHREWTKAQNQIERKQQARAQAKAARRGVHANAPNKANGGGVALSGVVVADPHDADSDAGFGTVDPHDDIDDVDDADGDDDGVGAHGGDDDGDGVAGADGEEGEDGSGAEDEDERPKSAAETAYEALPKWSIDGIAAFVAQCARHDARPFDPPAPTAPAGATHAADLHMRPT
jgi:hypothetical protein